MSGFKEDVLIPELVSQGFGVRESKRIVDAILESVIEALQRHETVDLPIGTFGVVLRPQTTRSWRFGKVVKLNSRRWRVDFLPTDEVELAASKAAPVSKRKRRAKQERAKPDSEEKRLSPYADLIFQFVTENVRPGDYETFFEELQKDGVFVLGEFERFRTSSIEVQPLASARELIKNSMPAEMPRGDWEHVYVCLSWFAYWSQRLIPSDIYSAAVREAKSQLPAESWSRIRI